MGSVFKKTYTKPLPPGAEVFTRKGRRFAKWKPAKGKAQTAPLTIGKDGSDRIVLKAGTYTAKYRDGSGIVQEKATGCRDKEAASRVLGDLERRAELVKAKVMTAGEDAISDHQGTPLSEHFDGYLTKLEADGTSPDHRGNVRRCLERIAGECRFALLGDLKRETFELWLVSVTNSDMGARTRNLHRASLVAFCNWCIATDRLTNNPFAKVKKANEDLDPRRKRRALTEEELTRLLDVARRRPLIDRMTVRKGPRKGEAYAKLRPETRAKLERLGQERALIYKTLVLTGLRQGELASLTVGQLDIDHEPSYLGLHAADEKNREGSDIALRADLAADLREWLALKLGNLQDEASQRGDPIPLTVPADTPLFRVPKKLVRVLNRDLKAAGIPKRDERGRSVDVHALRHSFGTLLSKGGVSPRTAQAAMRHSTINLTMNTYTDPRLLDVHGALNSLPGLPLNGGESECQPATGTADASAVTGSKIAPVLAPKSDKPGKSWATSDKRRTEPTNQTEDSPSDVSAFPGNRKTPLTPSVNEVHQVGDTGLEPVTPSLSSTGRRDVSIDTKRLTKSDFFGCPNGCPSSQIWLHEDESDISPVETIMVMIEELLQSAVVSDCFRLSFVLADEDDAIRINTTAMPNGIVYSRVDEVA